jgi:hypothetical protein
MANNWVVRTITATVLLAAGSESAIAAGPVTAQWREVCRVAGDRELSITMQGGETVTGYCMAINVDDIAVRTKDQKIRKIARSALSRIDMRRTKGHALASLGKGVLGGLHQGRQWLLSPAAPLGIVLIPGTLAWGVVAAPFCLLGDLHYKISGSEEIKVL